jgi:hypothetical protein
MDGRACLTIHVLVARSPKWPPSTFGRLLKTLVVSSWVEPLVSYLKSTVAIAACDMAIVCRSANCACFACRVLHLRAPSPPSLPPYRYRRSKKTTIDKLSARAKANGYQRGVHRDNDSLRDQNKHVDEAMYTTALVTSINASTKSPTHSRFGEEKVRSNVVSRRQLLLNGQLDSSS